MSTYLLGHQQCFRLEGVCSNFKTGKSGVPQGSLSGPSLFDIFINDLNFCVPNVSLRLYADDTTAYLSDVFPTILEFSFNKDLRTLSSWFESNHLTVDTANTQALSVASCDYHYSLFLKNARIEFLQSIKILGVTLDKDLSYKEHISDELKKAYMENITKKMLLSKNDRSKWPARPEFDLSRLWLDVSILFSRVKNTVRSSDCLS